jgi:formiminotetrahydrofolate cyclodeaminase
MGGITGSLTPSELLSVLQYSIRKITRVHTGLSNVRINTLCKNDPEFRKNLMPEIRDILIAAEQLQEYLEEKE